MQLVIMSEGDGFFPIEASFLDICDKPSISTLKEIDDFTKQFTKEEIFESLKRSNIQFPEMNENTRLMIIQHEGKMIRKYNAYTKENNDFFKFNLFDFFIENLNNKNILNQLKNSLETKKYIPKDLFEFICNLNSASTTKIINDFTKLQYEATRYLTEFILERIAPKLEQDNSENLGEEQLRRKREI